ncbi:MAG: hypothetical protein RL362_89, partial [Bacteroidota bacterium]
MNMRQILIIGLLILAFVTPSWSQKVVNFSTDKEEFIKQLSGLFNEQKKGSGKEIIEKQLEPIWI